MQVEELIRFIVQLITAYLLMVTLNFCGQTEKKSGAMASKTASNQAQVMANAEKTKGQKKEKESKTKDSKKEVKGDKSKKSKEKKDGKDEEKVDTKRDGEMKEKSKKDTSKDSKPSDKLKAKPQEAPKIGGQKSKGGASKKTAKDDSKKEGQTQRSIVGEGQKEDEQTQTSTIPKPEGDESKSKSKEKSENPTQMSIIPKPEDDTEGKFREEMEENLTQVSMIPKPEGEETKKVATEDTKEENTTQTSVISKAEGDDAMKKPKEDIDENPTQMPAIPKPEKDESKRKDGSEKDESAIKFSHKILEWDEKGGQQTMTVTNTTETTQAIKIKSSDNKIFRVYPVYSNAQPGQCVTITVNRQAAAIKMDKIVIVVAPNKDKESPEKVFKKPDLKLFTSVVKQTGKKAIADTGRDVEEEVGKQKLQEGEVAEKT